MTWVTTTPISASDSSNFGLFFTTLHLCIILFLGPEGLKFEEPNTRNPGRERTLIRAIGFACKFSLVTPTNRRSG